MVDSVVKLVMGQQRLSRPLWGLRGGALLLLLFLLFFQPAAGWAHVGSKDVFQTIHAGPYVLYVTVRPPNVIPGVATVEVRSAGAAVIGVQITPLPLTGEAAKHPPSADRMRPSATDPAFFTGSLWLMAAGAWQVRLEVDGAGGRETAAVPVLAVPLSTLKMQPAMGTILAVLGLFLVVSMAGVVGAAVRESRLRPGLPPTPALRRRGMLTMAASLLVMGLMVYFGGRWWNVEAAVYARDIYSRPATTAELTGDRLDLRVQEFQRTGDGKIYAERFRRRNDDYLPDHGHLIHLYAIREPEMDAVFHLHPVLAGPGDFRMELPAMPPGRYRLYGDVVHGNGFPETLLAMLDVPAGLADQALGPEDAAAHPPPLDAGPLGASFRLPDGYTMVWDRPETLTAGTAYGFRFRLLDPVGQPAAGMEPYLGMAGHAAFVKTDGSVFAHTHPEGSAAMADVMLANPLAMREPGPITPEVEFPYGFPSAGRYRIFIQMKHGGVVETGVFDALVR